MKKDFLKIRILRHTRAEITPDPQILILLQVSLPYNAVSELPGGF
jgi:hypothetical protein